MMDNEIRNHEGSEEKTREKTTELSQEGLKDVSGGGFIDLLKEVAVDTWNAIKGSDK